MLRYAVTIFLSAFLLFQVQPLIGKRILPWFGGTPAVWTTCMLFFQVALLAGYSYAHFLTSKFKPRSQMFIHLALLIGSLAFLPIAESAEGWKPTGDEMPIGRILGLLTTAIGLPYFLLSTTGPLLQEGYRRETGHPPYRLYSLSNVGSLLALLSYPFVFEPQLTLQAQIWTWTIGYVVFVAFCGWCTLSFAKPAHAAAVLAAADADIASGGDAAKPTVGDILLWLGLAACGSALLLGTTNQLCQEITSVPFLWVLPLAIYLISFIICFDHDRWYRRTAFLALLVIAEFASWYALRRVHHVDMWLQLAIYSGALWVCCMVCHGELARSRPAPRYATLFYLMVSAGGAIGGVLVAIVAPLVLQDFLEYKISLVATVLLSAVALLRHGGWSRLAATYRASGLARFATTATIVAVVAAVAWYTFDRASAETVDDRIKTTTLDTARNFYGVLRVVQEDTPDESKRSLMHGTISHGYQYLDPVKGRETTSYFGHRSGIGLAIDQHAKRHRGEPMRIGIMGLGCGTLAAYGQPGDTIRYYEINPDVIDAAQRYFTYIKDSKANMELVLGDARIKMEREAAAGELQRFDVLAMDAFSSDAIPMHLLTREAIELFCQHLNPDGLLCIHITNRYVNLTGVVRGIAEELGMECVMVDSAPNAALGLKRAWWIIMTTNRDFLRQEVVSDAITAFDPDGPAPIVWTDDYASLWKALDPE